MDDMKNVIIPKSDQLNADDLLAGPKTIKITEVTIKGGAEQPISIHYEGENGKPYKACKSMCRVMVAAWGADSSKYAGKSMTIYCDPKVRWAGLEVGGIRISHMSDISETLTMALTVTRGNKKPYVIHPLIEKKPEPPKQQNTQANNVANAFQGTLIETGENKPINNPVSNQDGQRIAALKVLLDIRAKYDTKIPISGKTIIDREIQNNDITIEKINELINRAKASLVKAGINL